MFSFHFLGKTEIVCEVHSNSFTFLSVTGGFIVTSQKIESSSQMGKWGRQKSCICGESAA